MLAAVHPTDQVTLGKPHFLIVPVYTDNFKPWDCCKLKELETLVPISPLPLLVLM